MIFERLPRRQTAILLVVCIAVLALVGKRIAAQGTARAPAAQAVALTENRAAGGANAAPRLVVYVVGAVRHAGLVRLSEGARVADALERAGGPSRKADLTLVNLAAPVADGQQIVVPTRAAPGASGGGTAAGSSAKVSLASATLEQLDALPGIGPVTAQKILDWRQTHGPLRSVDDLDAIPGIGPARVEQLRDLVTPVSRLQELLDRGWPAIALGAIGMGLAAANWIAFPRLAGIAASVAALGAAFRLPTRLRLALAALALGALGLWWGGLRLHELDRSYLATRIGEPAGANVVVTGAASVSPYAVRVAADVRRFDGVELRERVLLELPAGRAPPQGAVLDLRARPVAPRGPETGFDERGWLERRGIHVVLHASGPWHVVGRRGGIGGVGDRLRTEIGNALSLGTTGERRSLVVGVVLGADEGIDPELRDAFKASGLYHLLAVSGQNIVLIGFGVLGLAYVLGLGRAVGHTLAIVAILAYTLAVGWQPSVVRAAVAGCLASLAWLLSRPSDRWHTMAMGAVVLLAWTPRSLLEPGFQLSFAAVGAIFLTMPRLRRLHEGYPVPAGLVEVVGISAACGIVTAPILWLQFGTIPLWTVPANALAEPAMPILLGCGLGAAVLAPVIPPAAVALSWIAGAAAAWIAFSARLIASLPYAQTSSRALVIVVAGALAAVVALKLVPPYRRRATIVTAGALVPLVWLGWWALHPAPTWSPPSGLRVSFLDVGQGDGILLETPEGAMLVDAGPPEARVDRQLRRLGLHSLAAIVISHAHRDHVGGAPAVLRSLQVGAVIDPMQPGQGFDERAMRSTARRLGVPLRPARVGRRYALGRLRIRVLWPDHAGSPEENPHLHGAVVLASYGSIDLLLTGDSESEVTRGLPLRRVEVLKVAHHGSSDPGLAEELRVLRPRVAVISVGAHNDYGHPRADTLEALHARPGLAVYRTDESGRVVLESDGRSLTIRTEHRPDHPVP